MLDVFIKRHLRAEETIEIIGPVSGIGNALLFCQQNSQLVTSCQCMRVMTLQDDTIMNNYEYKLKLTEIVSNM